MIDASLVEECIRNGSVVEVNDFKDAERIIVFYLGGENDIYTVVAAAIPSRVITVCRTEKEAWEHVKNGIIRR